MKYLKYITLILLFLSVLSIKAQCTWTNKWGLDCPSGPVTISGCGNTSSITSFCAPNNPSDCGCAKNSIWAVHSVSLPSALCNCDCSNLRLVVYGISYANGDVICCLGVIDQDCGNSCGCARVEFDCTNKEIRLVCP